MNKTKQFKIETPALTVESDTESPIFDVVSVVLVFAVFLIGIKILSLWIKGMFKRG
tara:strand:- start:617 stop:784 length:168 start_codon:yes stop_codon:yes gene_type:complete